MTIYEAIALNKELLNRLHDFGIKMEDYKFVKLFEDYKDRVLRGEKISYIVTTLAVEHNLCERTVYKVINFFSQDCTLLA